MRTCFLVATLAIMPALAIMPGLAMAQNQTSVTGRDTPRDPASPASPRTVVPTKPDQTTVPNPSTTLRTKDPFEPTRDQNAAQRALPERASP